MYYFSQYMYIYFSQLYQSTVANPRVLNTSFGIDSELSIKFIIFKSHFRCIRTTVTFLKKRSLFYVYGYCALCCGLAMGEV